MEKLTETEKLLLNARDIARRAFDNPTEATVMDLFRELCNERDRMAWAIDGRDSATAH